jgi:pyruvate ferredoxin oxidoreductase gamma subunit
MKEIIILGRGGQGAVTSSQLLAIAAFYDGKKSQAFPAFGVERRGAPTRSFTRINDKEIKLRSQIYNSDYVLILDSGLINEIDLKNVKEKIIINSNKKFQNKKIISVDATKIALDVFGKPIVNTAILGAFSKITKEISLNSLLKAMEERFEEKGREIIKQNKEAVKKVYESC